MEEQLEVRWSKMQNELDNRVVPLRQELSMQGDRFSQELAKEAANVKSALDLESAAVSKALRMHEEQQAERLNVASATIKQEMGAAIAELEAKTNSALNHHTSAVANKVLQMIVKAFQQGLPQLQNSRTTRKQISFVPFAEMSLSCTESRDEEQEDIPALACASDTEHSRGVSGVVADPDCDNASVDFGSDSHSEKEEPNFAEGVSHGSETLTATNVADGSCGATCPDIPNGMEVDAGKYRCLEIPPLPPLFRLTCCATASASNAVANVPRRSRTPLKRKKSKVDASVSACAGMGAGREHPVAGTHRQRVSACAPDTSEDGSRRKLRKANSLQEELRFEREEYAVTFGARQMPVTDAKKQCQG